MPPTGWAGSFFRWRVTSCGEPLGNLIAKLSALPPHGAQVPRRPPSQPVSQTWGLPITQSYGVPAFGTILCRESLSSHAFAVASSFPGCRRKAEHHRCCRGLHISQPALTRSIRQLENTIGVPLFERLPTGVALTKQGEVLARRVKLMELEYRHALSEISALEQGITGTLRIGAGPMWVVDDPARASSRPFISSFRRSKFA